MRACVCVCVRACVCDVCVTMVVVSDMSSSLEGGLGDVAIEVLHRLLFHLLLSPEEEVGVPRESIEAFVQTLRRGTYMYTYSTYVSTVCCDVCTMCCICCVSTHFA